MTELEKSDQVAGFPHYFIYFGIIFTQPRRHYF